MQMTFARLIRPVALCAALALCAAPIAAPTPAHAQNLFAPAITVDDAVITNYEIEQRARMLTVLNAPGDPSKMAREQLIEDRLRLQASRAAGITPSEQDVLDGMEEFAGRANLSREAFTAALASEGVAEQTFRDFVQAGLSWRQLVQARFGGQSAISQTEIDRALSGAGGQSNVRLLLSEIIMPAQPQEAAAVQARAERLAQTTSTAEFSAAARQYSATATRDNGGRLPWKALDELPPQLRSILMALSPGEVTAPIPLQGAVALFQLRNIEEAGYTPPEIASVDYAAYYMAGGRSTETLAKARVLAQRVDRCDDLYGIAKGQPASVLTRETLPPSQLPTDVAFELSKLDPGEVSTALTRSNGQTLMFLMLCGRTAKVAEDADRNTVEMGLRNQRLGALSDSYLAQLRANARIVGE
ncbi:peptidylprolyl isomerase [Salipiger sp. 1_MG-2023]|uniref:peptidylprolyl isomerase n=1 Tax=Salipiger sp. 1_MG-2023 TaxID=3062665 RepID=UPI0026E31ABA|nr:peptidylprolyl isomerase [Salipiger sp. 1_MG-2023]MDO6586688.1 peptidylprolyl isomerase [Salipiger sp. 1_MG-2023]